jgi:hypothetical protein
VYAKQQNYNNLIVNSNEFIFVPSGQSGQIYFNYRTASAAKDGAITGYVFCDGAGNNLAVIGNGTFSGNAASATKLATARTINGTSFDGTANITTANWGTARNISIADSDSTNTGSAVSVNGSAAVTLKLPAKIKATLNGNADTATTATKLTSNAGSSVNPIYFSGGKPAACSYQFGNDSGNAAVSNGTLCKNLNADKLDGYDSSYYAKKTDLSVYATKTDISTMATQTWVDQNFAKKTDLSIYTTTTDLTGYVTYALSNYATQTWITNKGYTTFNDLSGYVNTVNVTGSGNVVTDVRKNGSTINVTKGITGATCYYWKNVDLPPNPTNGTLIFCKECRVYPTNGHPIMEAAGTSVVTPVGSWYGTNDRSTIFVYSEDAGQWIAFYCG